MRRNPYESYHDAMQVCLKGHLITDSYYDSPEFRKKYCTSCGSETIHQCPNCSQDIKGNYVVPNVMVLTISSIPVPKLCEYCGKKFPWASENQGETRKISKKNLSLKSSNIDDRKKKSWLLKIANAETGQIIKELLNEPSIIDQQKNHSNLINLSARWNLIEETQHRGLEDIEKVFKIKNQINDALVKIIHEMK